MIIVRILICLIFILVAFPHTAMSQSIGIGTESPHPSAALHVTGEDQGLLIPFSEVGDVIDPALGLLFFSPTTKKYYSWTSTEWVQLLNQTDSHWLKSSNTIHVGNQSQVVIGDETAQEKTDLTIVHDDDEGYGLSVLDSSTTGSSFAANFTSHSPVGGGLTTVNTGTDGKGLLAAATGDNGAGVHAIAYKTDALAGYFINISNDGTCLQAISPGTYGTAIHGEGYNGGLFTSDVTNGSGVFATVTGNASEAILSIAYEDDALAGNFRNNAESGTSIQSIASGDNGIGIESSGKIAGKFTSSTSGGNGIQAIANGDNTTGGSFLAVRENGYGVHSQAIESSSLAGYFLNSSTDGNGIGLYAQGQKYAGFFEGNVEAHVPDNFGVSIGLKEGAGFGFEFNYVGLFDQLRLWSRGFSGNEAVRMTWTKDGKVGIGTTSPTERLHVNGNALVTGNVSTSCGVVSCSDARYKTDVEEIKSALENIEKLTGVYYNWDFENYPDHNFTDTRQIGIIAQELEKEYPELVYTNKDGYKSVAYDKLGPILVQAIKELTKNYQSQEARLLKIEEQLAALQVQTVGSAEK